MQLGLCQQFSCPIYVKLSQVSKNVSLLFLFLKTIKKHIVNGSTYSIYRELIWLRRIFWLSLILLLEKQRLRFTFLLVWNNFSSGALKSFAIFTWEKPVLKSFFNLGLLQACHFIKKRLQHRCFPVNIATFLKTPTLTNICEWLLLKLDSCFCLHIHKFYSYFQLA